MVKTEKALHLGMVCYRYQRPPQQGVQEEGGTKASKERDEHANWYRDPCSWLGYTTGVQQETDQGHAAPSELAVLGQYHSYKYIQSVSVTNRLID